MPILPAIQKGLNFIADALPWTPIGRGILAAREQSQMAQYRNQLMQRQQQEFDLADQQRKAAQAAFTPGTFAESIQVTPKVTDPNYAQARQQFDQTKVGTPSAVDYLPSDISSIVQGLASAGQFDRAAQLMVNNAPQAPEWVDETHEGRPGQRSAKTNKFDPFPQQAQAAQVPQTRQIPMGEDLVTFEYVNGQWREIGRAPRFRPETAQPLRGQQGGVIMHKSTGEKKFAEYEPSIGYFTRDAKGNRTAVNPDEWEPSTPGVGAPLGATAYNKLEGEYNQNNIGLQRLEKYFNTLGGTDFGIQRIANDLSANLKTLFGSGQLDAAEFAQRSARQQLQTLLGAMRLETLGPGVLTEFDAQRLIEAAGGNVNALQNPQVAMQAIQQVYEFKRSTTALQREQLLRSSRAFGAPVGPIYGPSELSGTIPQPSPQDTGGIPPAAIQELQSDPSPEAMREFDEVFGPGAAQRVLGQ